MREHNSYIKNLHTNQSTGEHFNHPGHELYHLKVSVLENGWDLGRSLLEARESKYIRDFMTELRGMNRKMLIFHRKLNLKNSTIFWVF